jgi:tetratricopeptide (TPR) repeat protein
MRLAAVLVLVGCAAASPKRPMFPDAPLQLRDDTDRDQAIDQLWVLPRGPARDAIRGEVAAALGRRIVDAIEEDQQPVAQELLFQLCSLWRDDPQAVGPGLAPQQRLVERLRAMFAKSGAIEPTIATLVLLAEIDHRTDRQAELDEILGFADDLAEAEHGDHAQRAQPIALLQPTALALPLPWLVDRYVGLLEARQRTVADVLNKQGATFELVRAHHDITQTSHRIANALARAGRADEIHAHISGLVGIGADRELAAKAEAVATHATPAAYLELAMALRNDKNAPDPGAALATCLRGLARFPTDASLYAAAAEEAASLGRIDQPIGLYEASIQNDSEVDSTVALRLGKLYAERIARLAMGGRPGAASNAWHELARYTSSEARRAPNEVWAQVAAIGETSLGRGLVSQGRLDEAEHELVASLGRAPSIDAYETLATIYFKTNRYSSARRYTTAGLALLGGETSGDRYHRAKLQRIAGDVARARGKQRDAAGLYLDSLRAWASLGEDKNLPHNIAAERKIDFGRVEWYLGNTGEAIELVQQAVDTDPDSASTCTTVVAFLLEIGRTQEALDTLHRTLGSNEIGELYKVYAALWAVGDARWHRATPDRLALEYLASRHGELWYELLAEAATGRLELAPLAAAATTGPRRAELAYYTAVLGLDPATPPRRLLEQVIDAGLVMDAEYDLARQYLSP